MLSGSLLIILASLSAISNVSAALSDQLFSRTIAQKYISFVSGVANTSSYPHTTKVAPYNGQEGQWAPLMRMDWWTAGFLPGSLMLLAQRGSYCPDGEFIAQSDATASLEQARRWSAPLTALEDQNHVGHDVGFISFPFWEDLKMNPNNETAKEIIVEFAEFLAGRFSPIVGCTRSWESVNANGSDFRVIIDNMVNLELFFIAADITGNNTYREMAMSHADKTAQYHIRPDGSTYHLVIYDSQTGAMTAQRTWQGYADNSTWSRGQTWGMYGFTSMYNRTGEVRYLETARRLAGYFVSRLPTGNSVPPWDFDAPDATSLVDTSAATIGATSMLFLSQMELKHDSTNTTGSNYWKDKALTLLEDTVTEYWRSEANWQALLSNGTSNNPSGSNSTGLIYGDYYFIKAGNYMFETGMVSCNGGTSAPGGENPNTGSSYRQGYILSSILSAIGLALGLLVL